MTKCLITFSVAVLLGFASAYTPNINFSNDLDCTSCIRGGYEFCINGTSDGATPTGNAWNCYKTKSVPSFQLPDKSTNSGYVCSSAMDQTAAIIAGCRPEINNVKGHQCGEYLVDLTQEAYAVRQIKDEQFPVNSSCTYRLFSTCGYPNAAIKILNPTWAQDFDIQYAAQTGILRDEDLASDWNLEASVDWEGSFGSGMDGAMDFISQGYNSDKIDEVTFTGCKGSPRNLWVTVTRVKQSKAKVEEQSFFETSRMLQNPPTPTLFYAIELGFASIQGNAKFLGAVSMALVAVLSVLAF